MRSNIKVKSAAVILLALLPLATSATESERAPERIATPPLGVKPALRQGLFADLQVGTFFTMNTDAQRIGRSVSNAQPYVGVGLGYDITRNVVAGAGLAYGASTGACFDPDFATGRCRAARSFSVGLINAYIGYLYGVTHQWYLGGKALGGVALMTPEPVMKTGGDWMLGFNGGVALSTEYHTHLEHFVLGLDVALSLVTDGRQLQLPGFAIYPRLKYVF